MFNKDDKKFTSFLKAAAFACFFCHGFFAIKNSSVYYSAWSVWTQSLVTQNKFEFAKHFLRTVGTIDIVVSFLFLRTRIPKFVFIWGIGWAFLTSISRVYFLGAPNFPIWNNVVTPLSEMLVRTPNWVIPLMLFRMQSKKPLFSLTDQKFSRWVEGAAFLTILGIMLRYLSDLNSPLYPAEILREGKSLLFFHLCGALALVATLAIALAQYFCSLRLIAVSVAMVAFLMPEVFELVVVHWRQGVLHSSLQAGEHLPLFVTFAVLIALNAPGNFTKPRLATSIT